MDLAFMLFYEFHMSIQMTDMSEFLDACRTLGRAASVMPWNMSVLDNISSTCELLMGFEELFP